MHAVRNCLIGGVVMLALAAAPHDSRAMSVPDSISLDSLAQYYGKVTFDHARHIRLTKDCANCHHHTTGTLVEDPNCIRCHSNSSKTKVVACKGCHSQQPFSAVTLREKDPKRYHLDKPGLKGAYHQNCLGCHTRMGGPTGCQDCHLRTKEGDILYSSGEYAPKAGNNSTQRH